MIPGVLKRVSSPTFVGRADELAALEAALVRPPAFLFVAGESGVGKSRLLSELGARAAADGARVLVGRCLELGDTVFPYAPLIDALRPVAREADLQDATRAVLADLMPEVGGPSAPADRGRLLEALLELLSQLAADAPLLLVIEDLHWADPSTRDFLTYLVRSLRDERLALVGTYRSDELHRRHPLRPLLAELERAPGAGRIELERFSRDEVAEQLSGHPRRGARSRAGRPAVRARRRQRALHRGAAGRIGGGHARAAGDAARRAARARRAADGRRAGGGARGRGGRAAGPARAARGGHRPRRGRADRRGARRGHEPGAGRAGRTRRTRSATRWSARPCTTTCCPASGRRCTPRWRRRSRRRRSGSARSRTPAWPPISPVTGAARSTCRGRSARRSAPGSPRGGCTRTARRSRTSRARWRSGIASPTPRSRRACRAPSCCGPPRGWPRIASCPGARSRCCARRSPAADPEDRVRLAGLHGELAELHRAANDHDSSDQAVADAMAILPDDAAVERARLRALGAKVLLQRGYIREAAAEAQAAVEAAERLGDDLLAARAGITRGYLLAALGHVAEGERLLRAARDRATQPQERARAVVNLSEILDLDGRTEQALAEVQAEYPRIAARAERSSYDTFLELQGVNHLLRLGRTAEAITRLPDRLPGDAMNDSAMYLEVVRADLAVLRGDDASRTRGGREPAPPDRRAARHRVAGGSRPRRRAARGQRGPVRRRARGRRARARHDRLLRRRAAAAAVAVARALRRGRGSRAARRRSTRSSTPRSAARWSRGSTARSRLAAAGPRARSTRCWRGPSSRGSPSRSARASPTPPSGSRRPPGSRRSRCPGPSPTPGCERPRRTWRSARWPRRPRRSAPR